MKYLQVIILVFGISSCSPEKEKVDSVSTENADSNYVVKPGCYMMVINKDTAFLELNIHGIAVSGNLEYRRFEKDDNQGSLTGTIKDNKKIIAWYKFQSEGIISVRQVIFKVNNMSLSEAYGDVAVRSDTAYFEYPHTLNYEDKHPYTPVDCNIYE